MVLGYFMVALSDHFLAVDNVNTFLQLSIGFASLQVIDHFLVVIIGIHDIDGNSALRLDGDLKFMGLSKEIDNSGSYLARSAWIT